MAAPICKTRRCRNFAARRKGRTNKRGLCHSCYSREWRALNPFENAFNNLRNHARARGKVFDLSFADFKAFAIRWDYMDGKGTARDSFHIDRKEETGGYTLENLQVITNAENARKAAEHRRSFERDKHGYAWQQNPKYKKAA